MCKKSNHSIRCAWGVYRRMEPPKGTKCCGMLFYLLSQGRISIASSCCEAIHSFHRSMYRLYTLAMAAEASTGIATACQQFVVRVVDNRSIPKPTTFPCRKEKKRKETLWEDVLPRRVKLPLSFAGAFTIQVCFTLWMPPHKVNNIILYSNWCHPFEHTHTHTHT